MIDINTLRGSTVRDNAGTKGELLNLTLPWVKVGWQDEGVLIPREESFLRSDPRMEAVEILTLDQGWIPLSTLIGTVTEDEDEGPRGPSLVEDLENLLLEKPRSPFKTAASIGPSVAGGWPAKAGGKHHMKHRKQDYWDCSGSNYKYLCKGKEGEKKKIKRDPEKKAAYNQDYKEYQKAQKTVAEPHKRIQAKNKKKRAAKKAAAAAKKPAKKKGLIQRAKAALKRIVGKK
jgi:hypothetical protein